MARFSSGLLLLLLLLLLPLLSLLWLLLLLLLLLLQPRRQLLGWVLLRLLWLLLLPRARLARGCVDGGGDGRSPVGVSLCVHFLDHSAEALATVSEFRHPHCSLSRVGALEPSQPGSRRQGLS